MFYNSPECVCLLCPVYFTRTESNKSGHDGQIIFRQNSDVTESGVPKDSVTTKFGISPVTEFRQPKFNRIITPVKKFCDSIPVDLEETKS